MMSLGVLGLLIFDQYLLIDLPWEAHWACALSESFLYFFSL
jgi:hypothetical protein